MLELTATTIFKIPPMLEGHVDESVCCEILESVFNAYEQDPLGHLNSNSGGWQSRPLFIGDYSSVDKLIDNLLMPAASQIYDKFGLQENVNFCNYWFNINRKYNYNGTHDHPGAFLSGVLYLKVPKDSGVIAFYSKDLFNTWLLPKGGHSKEFPGSFKVNPQVGKLLIFPGYFQHEVEQNLTNDPDDRRVSIAFNIR